ncbi:DNA primase family protein [Mesorhizobium sp. ORM8.1]
MTSDTSDDTSEPNPKLWQGPSSRPRAEQQPEGVARDYATGSPLVFDAVQHDAATFDQDAIDQHNPSSYGEGYADVDDYLEPLADRVQRMAQAAAAEAQANEVQQQAPGVHPQFDKIAELLADMPEDAAEKAMPGYAGILATTIEELRYARIEIIAKRMPPPPLLLSRVDHMKSARQFSALFPQLHLTHWRGDFYVWRGEHYASIDDDRLKQGLWNFLDKAEVFEGVNKAGQNVYGPYNPNKGLIENVVAALGAVTGIPTMIEAPCWKSGSGPDPRNMVPLKNGLLNIANGNREMFGLQPAFFNLGAANVAYNKNAPVPTNWHAFLKAIFPDDAAKIDTLQEIIGYLITQDTSQQKIFIFQGRPRGGKGTVLRVIEALVGPVNYAAATLAEFQQPFGMEGLIGKSICVVPDAALGKSIDSAIVAEKLKSISGEDTISVGRKFKKAWYGRLNVRVLIACNQALGMFDASGALASRLLMLRFRQSFLGKEDTTLFEQKLLPELDGILLWALNGLDRLRARGKFIQPDDSVEEVKAIARLGSPIMQFIEECCEVGTGKMIKKEDLYSRYRLWCTSTGHKLGTDSWMMRDLKAACEKEGIELHDYRPQKQPGEKSRPSWILGIG